jgi:sRNA-binding regulator protein Hfq
MADNSNLIRNGYDEICIAEKRFLEVFVDESVNIYLTNGVKIMNCRILEHDDLCLIVTQRDATKRQLIYKDSIATVQEI